MEKKIREILEKELCVEDNWIIGMDEAIRQIIGLISKTKRKAHGQKQID